mmetsp:Transcript_45517/g.117695  ORF Transcript_45517/g.117695 Transcript_45517/m.117695 type:complete len:112 (+) Transcript_45517:82-417(+)
MEFEPGSVVLWQGLEGGVGVVKRCEAGIAEISFAAGRETVKASTVRALVAGDLVRYSGSGEDIPSDSLGRVTKIAPTGMITAVFPEGEFTLPYITLAHVNTKQALRAGYLL